MSGGPALGPALDLRPPQPHDLARKCGKSSEEGGSGGSKMAPPLDSTLCQFVIGIFDEPN